MKVTETQGEKAIIMDGEKIEGKEKRMGNIIKKRNTEKRSRKVER